MRGRVRIVAAVSAGLAVGVALMAHDHARDAGWAITAAQIADARASGKPGVETRPGTFVAEPLAGEGAGLLPLKWILCGLAAGFAVLAATGGRRSVGSGEASPEAWRDRSPRDR